MASIDLMLCVKGNEVHYCNEDTAGYWADHGWTVFALEPRRVAGAESLDTGSGARETTQVVPATEVVPDVSALLTEVGNG